MNIATCAKCGKRKELCDSCRIEGIKRPRVCKECLLESMSTGDYDTNVLFWFKQIIELHDLETVGALQKEKERADK